MAREVTRCAIYTRKSHEERDDSQLSSIDRQHELCQAYVDSQAGAGWTTLAGRFDDLGYSGASIDRPALRRMMAAIDAGEIDVVVVYKIDRLSRALRDFVNLVERFDKAGTTFVSVTQAFSTNTSIGRLTLNVLLSFAQFERELIGERGRDWQAGARARGLWPSGRPPYGYRVQDLKLEVVDDQVEVVRMIYRRFIALGSFARVAEEVAAAGHVNRFGNLLDGRMIRRIVSSRAYRGEVPAGDMVFPGRHAAIVTERMWRRAQDVLKEVDARWAARGEGIAGVQSPAPAPPAEGE